MLLHRNKKAEDYKVQTKNKKNDILKESLDDRRIKWSKMCEVAWFLLIGLIDF